MFTTRVPQLSAQLSFKELTHRSPASADGTYRDYLTPDLCDFLSLTLNFFVILVARITLFLKQFPNININILNKLLLLSMLKARSITGGYHLFRQKTGAQTCLHRRRHAIKHSVPLR